MPPIIRLRPPLPPQTLRLPTPPPPRHPPHAMPTVEARLRRVPQRNGRYAQAVSGERADRGVERGGGWDGGGWE